MKLAVALVLVLAWVGPATADGGAAPARYGPATFATTPADSCGARSFDVCVPIPAGAGVVMFDFFDATRVNVGFNWFQEDQSGEVLWWGEACGGGVVFMEPQPTRLRLSPHAGVLLCGVATEGTIALTVE